MGLDDLIEPYNKTLNEMSAGEIKSWADSVLKQLKAVANLDKNDFTFLAGNNYRKFLLPHIKNYEIPMLGLGIGKQLKWLTDKTKNEQKLPYNPPMF